MCSDEIGTLTRNETRGVSVVDGVCTEPPICLAASVTVASSTARASTLRSRETIRSGVGFFFFVVLLAGMQH